MALEAAQQCLEAAAGLSRLGIGLHCCNTRHRAKMGCPPRLPSAACLLPWSTGRSRTRPPAARRTACCIASASCRELSQIGARYHGRREVPGLVPRYLQCGPPEEVIVDGDWAILEIVGCPSFRDHTPCPKRQQHTSDPFVLAAAAAGCRMYNRRCLSCPPALSLIYLVPTLVRLERAESDSWWAHAWHRYHLPMTSRMIEAQVERLLILCTIALSSHLQEPCYSTGGLFLCPNP